MEELWGLKLTSARSPYFLSFASTAACALCMCDLIEATVSARLVLTPAPSPNTNAIDGVLPPLCLIVASFGEVKNKVVSRSPKGENVKEVFDIATSPARDQAYDDRKTAAKSEQFTTVHPSTGVNKTFKRDCLVWHRKI